MMEEYNILLIEIDFLTNIPQFNFLLFFILIAISYVLSNILGFKSFKSVLAFHASLIAIFSICELIDFLFLLIAVIEFVVLFFIDKGSENL